LPRDDADRDEYVTSHPDRHQIQLVTETARKTKEWPARETWPAILLRAAATCRVPRATVPRAHVPRATCDVQTCDVPRCRVRRATTCDGRTCHVVARRSWHLARKHVARLSVARPHVRTWHVARRTWHVSLPRVTRR